MAHKTALVQGTLDLLILKALSSQELHGLGVSRRIHAITRGTFHGLPGSLFYFALTVPCKPLDNSLATGVHVAASCERHFVAEALSGGFRRCAFGHLILESCGPGG